MSIDVQIQKATQDAYLWLFDRTGIYVSTIGMATQVSVAFLQSWNDGKINYMAVFVAAFLSINLFARYHLQHSGSYETYNAVARHWYEFKLRHVACVSWLAFAMITALLRDWGYCFASLLQLVYFGYMMTWQIRKREPPEKMVFAPHGAS